MQNIQQCYNCRSEIMEKQLQLRTKAMREKDEIREIRKYKFCLIRIRFADGLYLQVHYFLKIILFTGSFVINLNYSISFVCKCSFLKYKRF